MRISKTSDTGATENDNFRVTERRHAYRGPLSDIGSSKELPSFLDIDEMQRFDAVEVVVALATTKHE